jgi:hypothetical protein
MYNGRQGVFPSNYVERMTLEPQQLNTSIKNNESSLNTSDVIENADFLDGNLVLYQPLLLKKNLALKYSNILDKRKKKVIGIGFGNIFSGKQIELKTKENFNPSSAKINDNLNASLPSQQQQQQPTLGKIQTQKLLPQPIQPSEASPPPQYVESDLPATAASVPPPTAPPVKFNGKIKARVLYNYVPTQPDELNLTAGEVINILDKNLEDDGWWRGEIISTGKRGVFPENFVEEITEPPLGLAAKRKTNVPSVTNQSSLQQQQQQQASLATPVVVSTNVTAKSNDSLTNSPSSSSSTNSISRPIEPSAPLSHHIAPALNGKMNGKANSGNDQMAASIEDTNNLSKSQSDLSEDLDDLQQSEDRSKLTHIKKTRQFNKRPPSFRSKNKVCLKSYFILLTWTRKGKI